MIDSLFLTKLNKSREAPTVELDKLDTKIEIVEQHAEVEEKGVLNNLVIADF